MIDLHLLRTDTQKVIAAIQKKDPAFDIVRLVQLDEQRRSCMGEVEELRSKRNELANQGKQGVTQQLREASVQLSARIKETETRLEQLTETFNQLYLACPNIPVDDIPVGGKESNKVVNIWGAQKKFDFSPKNHVELGEQQQWFDFTTAATMTKNNFVLYKNEGVKLIYALTMFMLKHNQRYGYQLILPPYLINEQSLVNASNFPKFKDQVYAVPADQLYLSPTSEVNLTNMYRDTIFEDEQLPIRMTAWTSCFRREAGGYGAHERGLIRIHQFEKAELYTLCEPEKSGEEQERMLECAQQLLQLLGLHYRVSLLATQDCSFPSAKTYDIEVWMPGQQAYYEVSSISNCTDFQARRAHIRYRKKGDKKTTFLHTLNGSSLAIPRLMVAIMETYQQKDGTIIIPEVLDGYGLY